MAKDPDTTIAIVIVSGIVIAVLFLVVTFGIFVGPSIMKYFKNQHVLKEGIPATAVIKAVTDTGNRFNYNPEVKLTVEVTPKDGKPYLAEVTTVLSVVDLPKYQPGAIIHVKYDPKQPAQVTLVNQ